MAVAQFRKICIKLLPLLPLPPRCCAQEYQALLAGGSVLLGIAPLYVLINAGGPRCT